MKTVLATLLMGVSTMAHAQEVTIAREGLSSPLAAELAGDVGSGRAGVVIVPGSGPTDRDGNNPAGIRASTYALLAEALAQEGIPSLRIDKRGMFASASALADGNDVTINDYVGDVTAWAADLRERTGHDCAWIAGHSEGAVVALRVAADAPDGICGVLLLSATGRPLAQILTEQLEANPMNAPILPEARRHIGALENGEAIVGPIHPALAPLFGPQVEGFVRSLFAEDPASLAGELDVPVLILHGREDLQVSDADAEALAAAQPQARLVMLEGVNHVLKTVPEGDRAANAAAYANPDLPLAEGVAASIVDFLNAN